MLVLPSPIFFSKKVRKDFLPSEVLNSIASLCQVVVCVELYWLAETSKTVSYPYRNV